MTTQTYTIVSINTGLPNTMTYKGEVLSTGINKQPIEKPIYLTKTGFQGDGQADLVHHGGEDKAVCVYPYRHYPYWAEKLNRSISYGAFGENLTMDGLTEEVVCIGDVYEVGEALVQVTQPRQPCHKLAKKYNEIYLPKWVQDSGYTGFYFRVLKEGWVSSEKPMRLVDKHPKHVMVSFANQIMHHEKENIEGIKRILEVDELSLSWKETFAKRVKGVMEDTKRRLQGENNE